MVYLNCLGSTLCSVIWIGPNVLRVLRFRQVELENVAFAEPPQRVQFVLRCARSARSARRDRRRCEVSLALVSSRSFLVDAMSVFAPVRSVETCPIFVSVSCLHLSDLRGELGVAVLLLLLNLLRERARARQLILRQAELLRGDVELPAQLRDALVHLLASLW